MSTDGKQGEIRSLEDVLDRMSDSGEGEQVSVDDMVSSLGQRSFGPLLLAPALIVVSPLSGIPGLPTVAALIIGLLAVQIVVGRDSIWLPRFLLDRKVKRSRVERATRLIGRVAKLVDRLVGERLSYFTRGVFARVIAGVCLMIAIVMPPLEVVPFANSTTGVAIGLFGLALTARDGLLAMIGLVVTFGGLYFAATTLLL